MKANLLILFGSVAISLLIGEVTVRIIYAPPPKTMEAFKLAESDYYRRDTRLGWVPNPNVTGIHNQRRSFSSTFTTNSTGLRDREHSFRKPEGVTRIVVLGDSFAWGWGVNDGEIFTDFIESSVPNTEVINLGVTAYGLRQEIAYYESLGERFHPDIVLVALVQNDIVAAEEWLPPQSNGESSVGEQARQEEADASAVLAVRTWLHRHSSLYGMLTSLLDLNRTVVEAARRLGLKNAPGGYEDLDSNLKPSLREYPKRLSEAFEQVRIHLDELRNSAEESGARLLVALVPARQSVDQRALKRTLANSRYWLPDFDLDKPYDQLMAWAAEDDLEVINPVDEFRAAASSGQQLYLRNDPHFNREGHDLFAQVIADYLRTNAK